MSGERWLTASLQGSSLSGGFTKKPRKVLNNKKILSRGSIDIRLFTEM